MTRIIAGFAGSLTIAVPRNGTRPTSDRVREAIFSSLEARGVLVGARVVDLYAGSGALGLEAASRGAAHVTLVEKNAQAAAICRRNAAVILGRAPDRGALTIDVSARSVQPFLDDAAGPWDVAFLDPPYQLGGAELAANLERLAVLLSGGAVVVVERGSRSAEPDWPNGLEPERRKNYGDTTLWWCVAAPPIAPHENAVDPH